MTDVEIDAETSSDMTIDVVGLDDINIELGGTGTPLHTKSEIVLPQPLRAEGRTEIAVTEPIVTQMTTDAKLDVEPVVVDLCLTLGIQRLPRQCIKHPYRRHLGLSVFGVEVMGLDWSGESSVVIDDLPSRPHVEAGGEHAPRPGSGRREQRATTMLSKPERREGGLHIRLGD